MISSRQIKAARALLGWTQAELAIAAGLHANAVNKIENELGDPRTSSLERVKNACEAGGIKFRGQSGVDLREDIFETLRFNGYEYMRHFTDDILSCLKGPKDEMLTYVTDEHLFTIADKKQNERYLKQRKKAGFQERCIMNKQHQVLQLEHKASYRWLPEKALGTIAYCLYHDRVAFIHWRTQEILIVRNKSLSFTFRGQFEFMWVQAKPYL